MRYKRIPDLDLARIGPLPRAQKWLELEKLKPFVPPHLFNPFRKYIPDITRAGASIMGQDTYLPWHIIINRIKNACREKNISEKEVNRIVSISLRKFITTNNIYAKIFRRDPLIIYGHSVKYWSDIYFIMDGQAVHPFFDPRRSKSLDGDGRNFVFSCMHERIRELEIVQRKSRLLIMQFTQNMQGLRDPINFYDDIELFDFDDIEFMVRETYEIWAEVLKERSLEARTDLYEDNPPLINAQGQRHFIW